MKEEIHAHLQCLGFALLSMKLGVSTTMLCTLDLRTRNPQDLVFICFWNLAWGASSLSWNNIELLFQRHCWEEVPYRWRCLPYPRTAISNAITTTISLPQSRFFICAWGCSIYASVNTLHFHAWKNTYETRYAKFNTTV